MSDNQDEDLSKKIEDLIKLLESAKSDPSLLKKISEDSIETLQSRNIHVEDEFKEAIVSLFETLSPKGSQVDYKAEAEAMAAEIKKISKESSAPSPPTGLTVKVIKEQHVPPPEVLNALDFWVKPWGFVLVVREPAIKYIEGGGTITGGVLGGIGAFSGLGGLAAAGSVLGPIGIGVGFVTGLLAAALAIYAGLIAIIDEGKGVYLTWTWAQVLPFLNITQLPIVTPIK